MIISLIILSLLLALAIWYIVRTNNRLIATIKEMGSKDSKHIDELATLRQWADNEVESARKDSRKRSRSVVEGQVKEAFHPFMQWWQYDNPSDARFLGSPIDFIVFNGLTNGNLTEVVFVEVGNENKQLNGHERQVRDIIQQGKVRWECIKINLQENNNG